MKNESLVGAQASAERQDERVGTREALVAQMHKDRDEWMNQSLKEGASVETARGEMRFNATEAQIETARAQMDAELGSHSTVEGEKTNPEQHITDQLKEINTAVQQSTFLSPEFARKFGTNFEFNRGKALEWIENKVAELEGSLRTIEQQRKEKKAREQLQKINTAVQQSTFLSPEFGREFGVDFEFNRGKALEWIEQKVAELESSLRPTETPGATPEDNPSEDPADAYLNAEMAELKRQKESEREASQTVESEPVPDTDMVAERQPIGAEAALTLRESFNEAERKQESGENKSKWGWIKERVKGLGTFGFWEVHQAERFRAGTKEVGKNVEAQSQKLEQTRDLDIDVAHEEALLIQEIADGQEGGMTKETIEAASKAIDAEKGVHNAEVMERIVNQARGELVEKLKKYKNEYGNSVLGAERLASFEAGLRNALEESTIGKGERGGFRRKEDADFTKTIRERMDPKYWKRYVYGGVEAALMLVGFKVAVTKFFAEGSVAAAKGVAGGIEKVVSTDIPMKDTIWNTSREWLMQHGVAHPSNADIMSISKQVALDNHIGVSDWGISGSPMDTAMGQGHLLSYKGAALLLAKIAAKAVI